MLPGAIDWRSMKIAEEKPAPGGGFPPCDPRTYMSAERTFLAWIRTGIALMGFGFVIARFGLFLQELVLNKTMATDKHGGFSLPAGVALIAIGIVVTVVAAIRHHRQVQAIDRGEFREAYGQTFAFSVAGILALTGLAVAIYLLAFV
jgi:inner membrane protein YidH